MVFIIIAISYIFLRSSKRSCGLPFIPQPFLRCEYENSFGLLVFVVKSASGLSW